MRKLFVDTGYWIALINPNDRLGPVARAASQGLSDARLYTTEMVLAELLAAFSSHGAYWRSEACDFVDRLESSSTIIVPQTSELFRRAVALYRQRLDKGWSLVDCASFVVMDDEGITEALAHDAHFKQAGYQSLLS